MTRRLLAGLLSLFCIALFDCRWGADIHVSLLYFLPVAFIAWYGTPVEGISLFLVGLVSNVGLSIRRGEFESGPFAVLFNGLLWAAMAFFIVVTITRTKALLEKERRANQLDTLTGLLNRKSFWESMRREASRCHREGKPLTVAYLDCDNFKEVNDEHGHKVGDEVLRTIGRTLKRNLRTWDLTARIGGDEFVLVLPATTEELAYSVLERTRRDLLIAMNKSGWKVTFSVGAVTFMEMTSVENMLESADALMYEVKHASKNRLVHAVIE